MNGVEVCGSSAEGRFVWHSYDLRPVLPDGWQQAVLAFADRAARDKVITPTSVTSREHTRDLCIPVHSVGGRMIAQNLPWLDDLYSGLIRDLAQAISREPVSAARDVQLGLNLHIQRGSTERYECHVDSNPIAALLYVTSHPDGSGGELRVANKGDVRGRHEVDADSTRIHPVAGQLVFFDARRHTHYVAPLRDPEGIRVVVVMTFYIPSCPEEMRPKDLNRHLGLD